MNRGRRAWPPGRSSSSSARSPLGWARAEDGTAYSIGVLITLPVLVLTLALIIEATLILHVSVGVRYAAYAAVRARVVWRTTLPRMEEDRTRLAAVHALVPYASGLGVHAPPISRSDVEARAATFHDAYRAASGIEARAYLLFKYRYADWATRVELLHARPVWGVPLTVRVRYEYPFHVGVIGRLLGHPAPDGGSFYTRTIEAESTLQDEGPKNARRTLGIRYTWR